MYCTHCGREVPDGQVCSCQSPPPQAPKTVCAVNPVVAVIKTIGRSPLFLILCILQTVSAGFSLLNSVVGFFDVMEDYVTSGPFDGYTGSDTLFDLNFDTSFVFASLFALALWLIYATCKSDQSPMVKTGGLSIVKVLLTIELIALYVVGGLAVVLLPLAFVLTQEIGNELASSELFYQFSEFFDELDLDIWWDHSTMTVLVVFILLMVIAAVVFLIIGITATRKSLKAVSENFEGILTDRSVSMFTVVLGFIIGGISLTTFVDLEDTALYSLSSLCAGGTLVLLALIGLKYRKEMEALRVLSRTPVPVAPYEPAPAVPVEQPAPLPAEEPVEAPVEEPVAEPVAEPAQEQPALNPAGYCTGCGTPLKEGQRFCAHCGRPANQ